MERVPLLAVMLPLLGPVARVAAPLEPSLEEPDTTDTLPVEP
jgi:hypothetical protein